MYHYNINININKIWFQTKTTTVDISLATKILKNNASSQNHYDISKQNNTTKEVLSTIINANTFLVIEKSKKLKLWIGMLSYSTVL